MLVSIANPSSNEEKKGEDYYSKIYVLKPIKSILYFIKFKLSFLKIN